MTSPLPPRRRGGTTTLAVVLGTLALVACAVPVLGLILWATGGTHLGDAKAAAARYLERIEASDDVAAYQLLCPDTRRRVSPDDFTARLSGARPVGHTVTRAVFLDEPGYDAAVDLRLTDRTGATREITLELRNIDLDQHGRWLVCGDRLI